MTDFVIKQLPYDLSNQAGLALIGKYLKRINLNALVDPAFPVRSGVANSDIFKSYLGLLCLARTTSMPSKASAKTPSSPAHWVCGPCHRLPPCANAWTRTRPRGLTWSITSTPPCWA